MPLPTTVLEFTTQRKDKLTAALSNANTAMKNAQQASATRTKSRDDLKAQIADLAADMAAVRKQLAGTVTPEDGAALLQKLQEDIINSRKKTTALAQSERDLAAAQADAKIAATQAERATAALAAATAAWKDAQIQDKRRNDLKAKLTTAPLLTIVADAAAAAGGATFNAAKNRLETDLPPALKTQAEERLTTESDRASAINLDNQQSRSLLETKRSSDGGIAGSVVKLQSEFQRADAEFTAYVTSAADRLKQAKALLARVGDPTVSPLTAAQMARIHDATLLGKATTAAGLEAARNDANVTLAKKQAALDEAIRQAIATDVDADYSTDAGVVNATKERNQAQTDLTKAQNDYTPAIEQDARDWEVTVPDTTWQLLMDFERARTILADLQNPAPAALRDAMNQSENALVTAMLAADKSARTLDALENEATRRAAMAAYESTAAERRRFSAVRGDF